MKCPHCDYETGYDSATDQMHFAQEGEFWELPVKLERKDWYDKIPLYACPSCKKTFID